MRHHRTPLAFHCSLPIAVLAGVVAIVGALAGCEEQAPPAHVGSGGEGEGDVGEGEGEGDGAVGEGEGAVGEGEGEGEGEGAVFAVTYYADVAPLIERKCLACHDVGGLAPFTLTTPGDVVGLADALAFYTSARIMPPWMPGPLSPKMRDDYSLTDDEIAIFQEFAAEVDASADQPPLGDPADAPPPVPPIGFPLTNPDITAAMSEPFTALGLDTGQDEFRCFVLDIDVPAAKKMIGFRYLPGNSLVDHHAIITLYSKDDLPALQNLDDTSAGADGLPDNRPGWSCFGEDVSPSVAVPVGRVGAWTPGNNGVVEYPGTASKIPGNVVVVVSAHYNVTNAMGADGQVDASLSTDQSALELYFAPASEESSLLQAFGGGMNLNALLRAGSSPIPPNAASHTVERRVAFADMSTGLRSALTAGGVGTVYVTGAGAHGHLILKHFEIIADEGAADEKVLLDIPAWDFHWQGQYTLENDIPLSIETPITVRCTYDNSEANRAAVGLDPTSVTVTSCEGTQCEMCIGTLQFVVTDPT